MIVNIAETGSTNTDLLHRSGPAELLGEGDWLVADRQSAGRGRLGRPWFDGHGNFMGSTVIELRQGDPSPPSLALMAGLAVHDAVTAYAPPGGQLLLKWPNDLLLDARKVAGILLERHGDRVVAGIGVNLVVAPDLPGYPTTTLAAQGWHPDRNGFAEDLAAAFARELVRWRDVGLATLMRRWESLAHPHGTTLEVTPPGEGKIGGTFAGLDVEGNLLLNTGQGVRTIHAGDVMLVSGGLPG